MPSAPPCIFLGIWGRAGGQNKDDPWVPAGRIQLPALYRQVETEAQTKEGT